MEGQCASDETLTREDVSRLVDRSYLTERLLMMAAQRLGPRDKQWFTLINGTPISFPRQHDKILDSLRSLADAESTTDRYCFLPVFENIHWTLFIVIFSSGKVQALHLDSIPPRRPRSIVKRMEKLLRELEASVSPLQSLLLQQSTRVNAPDSGLHVLSAINSFSAFVAQSGPPQGSEDFMEQYLPFISTGNGIKRSEILALLSSSRAIQRYGNAGKIVVALAEVRAREIPLQVMPDASGSAPMPSRASLPLAVESVEPNPRNDVVKPAPEGWVFAESAQSMSEVIEISCGSDSDSEPEQEGEDTRSEHGNRGNKSGARQTRTQRRQKRSASMTPSRGAKKPKRIKCPDDAQEQVIWSIGQFSGRLFSREQVLQLKAMTVKRPLSNSEKGEYIREAEAKQKMRGEGMAASADPNDIGESDGDDDDNASTHKKKKKRSTNLSLEDAFRMYTLGRSTNLDHAIIAQLVGVKTATVSHKLWQMRLKLDKIILTESEQAEASSRRE